MNIKAVLFDMDGLIFDTEGLYKKCWQEAVSEQGLLLSDEYYQHFIGVQDAECEHMLAINFGKKLDIIRFQRVRDKRLKVKRESGIAYKPGFKSLFIDLKNKGLTCALVTSSTLQQVQHHFEGSHYLAQFDTVISAEDVKHGKPAPDCYRMACKRLTMPPSECLVLEDSNNGMRAALDAGCQAIMIPDLQQADADVANRAVFVLENLLEIKQLI